MLPHTLVYKPVFFGPLKSSSRKYSLVNKIIAIKLNIIF